MTPRIRETPVDDFGWVSARHVVCDIIYNPAETAFLKQAKARGATIQNGIGMLAGQGTLAFELLTGKLIPYEFLKREVAQYVNQVQ